MAEEGIELEVPDLRTLYLLDRAAVLGTARGTSKVILLPEENRFLPGAGDWNKRRAATRGFLMWHLYGPRLESISPAV